MTRDQEATMTDANTDIGPGIVPIVGGASRGFTVLLLGGVVQPWVGVLYQPLGYVWLALVAVAAFGWAAWPRTVGAVSPSPVRADRATVGVAAALGSYALVLPLVVLATGGVMWSQLGLTAATAVLVGGLVGWFGRVTAR